jgi:hypothetical protein
VHKLPTADQAADATPVLSLWAINTAIIASQQPVAPNQPVLPWPLLRLATAWQALSTTASVLVCFCKTETRASQAPASPPRVIHFNSTLDTRNYLRCPSVEQTVDRYTPLWLRWRPHLLQRLRGSSDEPACSQGPFRTRQQWPA